MNLPVRLAFSTQHSTRATQSVFTFIVALCLLAACTSPTDSEQRPNIIFIYFDDLGYGDVSSYGFGKLNTPNIDKLASGGVRFTNGYATSATCTPSRYALLTGRYPWRNKEARILPGTAPLLLDTSSTTLPKLLQKQGYVTGIVGKWHLGLGNGNIDWNKHVRPGPNEVGFDYSYILAATQDRVPTVYIENGSVVGLRKDDPIQVNYETNFDGEPTGKDHPELLRLKWHHGHNQSIVNGIPRIGYMKGGKSALWNDEAMADSFLLKVQEFVSTHREKPFFHYYAMQQPHVPRTPHPRFVGRSGLGPRGDAILEADWCVGKLLQLLQQYQLGDNTLIVLSSDNGPVLNDGYYDMAAELNGLHQPSGPLRGGKYSLYEGGTRVPFITYWPGKIKPRVSSALVCQVDLFSSLAHLVGSNERGEDSMDLLETLLGKSDQGRQELVIEASSRTALRKGEWVLIPSYPGEPVHPFVNIELGNAPEHQLFNLSNDSSQQKNLANQYPDKVNELLQRLNEITSTDIKR